MKLKLVKLTEEYKPQLIDMLEEWIKYNKENESANKSPSAIFKNDYHDFDNYVSKLEHKEGEEGKVPDSVFFCFDEERNIFVGAVNIRHRLNDFLLAFGGHIGDGVRPSERRKGIATQMVKLALQECKNIGIDRVLMTCEQNNIGSEKSITNNGGVLENIVYNKEENIYEKRFWIEVK